MPVSFVAVTDKFVSVNKGAFLSLPRIANFFDRFFFLPKIFSKHFPIFFRPLILYCDGFIEKMSLSAAEK